MEPKNGKERKKAFTSFLLLFGLSAVIFILLSFFSTRVVEKDNAELNRQLVEYNHNKDFSNSFKTQLNLIYILIDSLHKVPINDGLINVQIDNAILGINNMIESDSVYNKDLYRSISSNLTLQHVVKKQLGTVSATGNDVLNLNTEINNLKNQLATCQSQIAADQVTIKTLTPH